MGRRGGGRREGVCKGHSLLTFGKGRRGLVRVLHINKNVIRPPLKNMEVQRASKRKVEKSLDDNSQQQQQQLIINMWLTSTFLSGH